MISNHVYTSDDDQKFHPELIAELFIGNVYATIVALNVNPVYNDYEVNIPNDLVILKIMLIIWHTIIPEVLF